MDESHTARRVGRLAPGELLGVVLQAGRQGERETSTGPPADRYHRDAAAILLCCRDAAADARCKFASRFFWKSERKILFGLDVEDFDLEDDLDGNYIWGWVADPLGGVRWWNLILGVMGIIGSGSLMKIV